MFGQMRWLGAGLVVCLASCSVDETTQVENTGGSGGSSASGGSGGLGGGTGGGGGSGGSVGGSAGAPAGGSAGQATGGTAGAPAGGTGGAAGTPSGGGSGGLIDPCNGNCTDPNATCSGSGTCDCSANHVNVDTDGNAQTAECKSSLVTKVTAELAITHQACGNLVIKLRGPDNTLITLMSRPGEAEAADDGGGGNSGDMSGMVAAAPVTFDDAAATSAESMGSGPPNQVVCQATGVCSYHPDHGAATGPTTLAAAFNGKSGVGTWRMCVADAVNNNTGTFESWELTVTTSDHQFVKAVISSLAVPENGYDGTLDPTSAACADITLP